MAAFCRYLLSMTPRFDLDKVTLKAASPGDLATLLKALRRYYRFDRIPFNRREVFSGLSLLLHDGSLGRAWLILNRKQTIGYTIVTFGFDLEFGGRQATVTDFYVEPRYRRKGVGRKVLTHVEGFCAASGVQAVELQVTGKNAAALAFYKSLGFEAHERTPMSKRMTSAPESPNIPGGRKCLRAFYQKLGERTYELQPSQERSLCKVTPPPPTCI